MNGPISALFGLLLLAAPAAQAQFTYTTNNATITLTGYTGAGGAVVISNFVTTIGDNSFDECTSLKSLAIPGSVTSVGQYAFRACTGLNSVMMPGSLTSLGDGAFYYCTSLTSVIIPGSISNIGDYAFGNCTSLTSVMISNGVTTIGVDAFADCNSLTSLTIPGSLTSIGTNAFESCTSLRSVLIPGSVTSIADGAFDGSGLTNVTIPAGVTSVGDYAFSFCQSLTKVTIPASVTNIGEDAFANCTILTAITVSTTNEFYSSVNGVLFNKSQSTLVEYPGGLGGSYSIPGTVTSIGVDAFCQCLGLTEVTIPSSVTNIGYDAFNGSGLTSVTVPGSVTSIADYEFFECMDLTSVTIFNGVTSIGDDAFAVCTNLSSLLIPSSVTSIGDSAFYGCASLTTVTIPASVTNIGEDAFEDCTILTAITVSTTNEFYSSLNGVLFDKSQSTLVEYPGGINGSYIIPPTVTNIGYGAFDGSGLTSVTIPASVTSIGEYAFIGISLTSLTSVYFQGNAPTADSTVFESDYNATVYYLPGTTGWAQFSAETGLPVVQWNPGSLQVTITPAAAITAGAQWQVDGATFQTSGTTVSGLSPGNHTVSFSIISGWITPSNQTVSVSADSTATAIGTYVPQPVFQTLIRSGQTLTLAWSTVAGEVYQLQCKTNLAEVNWYNLGYPLLATNGIITVSDTIGPDAQRFYRVVQSQ
jgi:hypothetical protein